MSRTNLPKFSHRGHDPSDDHYDNRPRATREHHHVPADEHYDNRPRATQREQRDPSDDHYDNRPRATREQRSVNLRAHSGYHQAPHEVAPPPSPHGQGHFSGNMPIGTRPHFATQTAPPHPGPRHLNLPQEIPHYTVLAAPPVDNLPRESSNHHKHSPHRSPRRDNGNMRNVSRDHEHPRQEHSPHRSPRRDNGKMLRETSSHKHSRREHANSSYRKPISDRRSSEVDQVPMNQSEEKEKDNFSKVPETTAPDASTLYKWMIETRSGSTVKPHSDGASEIQTLAYFEEARKSSAWRILPDSVISATITLIMREDQITRELLTTIGPSTLSATLLLFLILLVILTRLWVGLPDLTHNENFCYNQAGIGKSQQICALGLFFLSIGDAFYDVNLEFHVVLFSTRVKRPCDDKDLESFITWTKNDLWKTDDLIRIRPLRTSHFSRGVCLVLILCEFLVWLAILIIGVKYILIQDTVSDLVQAIVAIVYLNDVDNVAYSLLLPEYTKSLIRGYEFEVTTMPTADTSGKNKIGTFLDLLVFNGTTVLIATVAVATVLGLHTSYC